MKQESLYCVLAAVTFSGLFTGWCVRMLRNRKNPSKSELHEIAGIANQIDSQNWTRPESTNFVQRRIQSTLETLMENGRMDDDATTRLVSRLDWWNQINRYLDMLKNTDESIDRCGHRNRVPDGLPPTPSIGSFQTRNARSAGRLDYKLRRHFVPSSRHGIIRCCWRPDESEGTRSRK